MKDILITIDGPAGAGKSTVSRILAERLGYRYIDTGALYRGIALETLKSGTDPDSSKALLSLCSTLELHVMPDKNGMRLFSGSTDISYSIRTPEVTMLTSKIAAVPAVRDFLLDLQRKLGAEKRAVFEGRDMGTVVFPEADIKFYLDASIKMRAERRFKEMPEDSGLSFDKVKDAIVERDGKDSSRKTAPLKKADDAVYIDASDISADSAADIMIAKIHEGFGN